MIGGGATGLGAAVDAASRGYRTLLLEAYDFAKGTSSRSTKLVHGGVRYLAQGGPRARPRGPPRARTAPPERPAPGPRPGLRRPRLLLVGPRRITALGLKLYDLLAGRLDLGPSRMVWPRRGPGAGPDPRARRPARAGSSTTTASSTTPGWPSPCCGPLIDLGGTALNYVAGHGTVETRRPASRGVDRPRRRDRRGFAIAARVVINATGVFADAVRRLDDPARAADDRAEPGGRTSCSTARSCRARRP